jgi:hypothetical protein
MATKTKSNENQESLAPVDEVLAITKVKQEALKEITWEQVQEKVAELGGDIVTTQDVTGDFTLVDQADLIGKSFGVLHYETREGDFNKPYVSVYVQMLGGEENGKRVVFNDGGAGVLDVLEKFTEQTGRTMGLLATKGLRGSTYDAEALGGCGKQIDKCTCEKKHPATTFYLA